MTDEVRQAAVRDIDYLVRVGFYDADEIVERVEESAAELGEVDHEWLTETVNQAMEDKLAAEATWPDETDCDRLDELFGSLYDRGIIALQNAGYTMSDGIADAVDACEAESGGDVPPVGYCFYHGQDLQRVIETGDLFLAFGAAPGSELTDVEVGEQVFEAAKAHHFRAEWPRSGPTRILLKGINWRCRTRERE
jgi:hypothetical protein